MGIYEVMRVNDKVRRLIAQKAGEDMIRDAAIGGHDHARRGRAGEGQVRARRPPKSFFRVVTEVKEGRAVLLCHAAVGVDFMACPHCGHRLNSGCSKCGRSLQAGWQFCPYCTTNTSAKPTKKQLRDQRKTPELPASNVAEFKNQNNR
jgi:RNA polymerase subunit RPABC4/transcription elongation factor Spt4